MRIREIFKRLILWLVLPELGFSANTGVYHAHPTSDNLTIIVAAKLTDVVAAYPNGAAINQYLRCLLPPMFIQSDSSSRRMISTTQQSKGLYLLDDDASSSSTLGLVFYLHTYARPPITQVYRRKASDLILNIQLSSPLTFLLCTAGIFVCVLVELFAAASETEIEVIKQEVQRLPILEKTVEKMHAMLLELYEDHQKYLTRSELTDTSTGKRKMSTKDVIEE
ncbi:gypsy/ty3 element polyprotein [Cucumis melo var. makuwa]|uniref:Gypsy/ty3 element polyprotein n=1 Tax=Cucumis melo var. makuwa TaxID=1194695 RepID=A0A5A7UAA9_CUCMM|nr:gypsy/ty3 element polyprotein [Cucumis melo var. makuwa]TYK01867.1 gypsy/ty3 element polyprotein [Cucumis melo var. makuwa]